MEKLEIKFFLSMDFPQDGVVLAVVVVQCDSDYFDIGWSQTTMFVSLLNRVVVVMGMM